MNPKMTDVGTTLEEALLLRQQHNEMLKQLAVRIILSLHIYHHVYVLLESLKSLQFNPACCHSLNTNTKCAVYGPKSQKSKNVKIHTLTSS